jgi:hypothetical protein
MANLPLSIQTQQLIAELTAAGVTTKISKVRGPMYRCSARRDHDGQPTQIVNYDANLENAVAKTHAAVRSEWLNAAS